MGLKESAFRLYCIICSVFGRIFFSGALVHATQFDIDARRPCRKQGIEGEISWPASRSEQLPIQAPVLNRLGNVLLDDAVGLVEVGKGSGDS